MSSEHKHSAEAHEASTASGSDVHKTAQTSGVQGNELDQITARQKKLQWIRQKKEAVLALAYNDKLLKLAVYSKCQVRY